MSASRSSLGSVIPTAGGFAAYLPDGRLLGTYDTEDEAWGQLAVALVPDGIPISRYITHEGSKWVVHAEDGTVLGEHDTQAEAEKHLAAIHAAQHAAAAGGGGGREGGGMDDCARSAGPELRYVARSLGEIRLGTAADGRAQIMGTALRYDSLSTPMRDSKNRLFREQFAPGAFSRALATGADVRALVNHDPSLILGRSTAGTLRIMDSPTSLDFMIDCPDTAIGEHYRSAVKRGDLTGMSFRFYKIRDDWQGAGDATLRRVLEADLDDISVVTYPAYPSTEAAARSRDLAEGSRHPITRARPGFVTLARMRLEAAEREITLTSSRARSKPT